MEKINLAFEQKKVQKMQDVLDVIQYAKRRNKAIRENIDQWGSDSWSFNPALVKLWEHDLEINEMAIDRLCKYYRKIYTAEKLKVSWE